MAAAALVASDSADAAMGVFSAAKALGLDFIEIGEEEYDFAIPVRHLDLKETKIFIEILKNPEFHENLKEIGGYGLEESGKIIFLG